MKTDIIDNKSLYEKISQVMRDLPKVAKGKQVGDGKNSYMALQHDDLTRALRDPCIKAGIVMIPSLESVDVTNYKTINSYGKESLRYEAQVWVKVDVCDKESGQSVVVKSFAHAFDTQDKSVGKAYSMAVKYAYLKLFMIESGDDEEERVSDNPIKVPNKAPTNNPTGADPAITFLKKKIAAAGWLDQLDDETKTYINTKLKVDHAIKLNKKLDNKQYTDFNQFSHDLLVNS